VDLVQHGGGTIGPNDVHKMIVPPVDEALDGEAKSWMECRNSSPSVGESEQHEEVEEPPMLNPGPPWRRMRVLPARRTKPTRWSPML